MTSTAHAMPSEAEGTGSAAARRLFPALPLALAALLAGFALFPPVSENAHLRTTFIGVSLFLFAWVVLLWAFAQQRKRELVVLLVPPLKSHYVQGCIQTSIYVYWGLYWPKVFEAAPLILAQLVFLFAFDGLLALSRGRAWRLSLGPLPIILSTNLFMWFKDDWFVFQFAMLASSALAKEFIRWNRDGKNTHIFNPSAFGLSLCSLILISTQSTQLTWGIEVATTLGWAPHMYLWIFVVGLIVQYFFAVTLMTLAAVAVLYASNLVYTQITGVYFFVDTNIPIAIFLGLHLLVTDPATSPRTNVGRVIFGGLYGAANFWLFAVLGNLGIPDFYDKLLPVPILNLSVKALDSLGRRDWFARFSRWEERLQAKKLNWLHMSAWAALFTAMFATGFVEGEHPGNSPVFWKQAYADGKPYAGRNWMKMVGTRADAGDPAACNQLGQIYLEGKIVPANPSAAGYYFARSCELGGPRGCENFARHYLTFGEAPSGELVARAFDGLEAGIEQSKDGAAGALVGLAYELGQGRPLDRARAFTCYAASVERGNLDGAKGVARLWLAGVGTTEPLARAAPVLERANSEGDATAMFFLAHLLHAGAGVAADEARADALLEQACQRNVREACDALARPERWLEPAQAGSK